MATIATTIEHNGVTYHGQIATIRSTRFGVEDHGIVTAYLNTEWQGGGVGVGGYCLDTPRKDESGKHIGRFGSAYGLDHLMRILETVGVDYWEKLPGKQVIVLFNEANAWGATAVGIAGITNGEALIFKEHAESFKEGD